MVSGLFWESRIQISFSYLHTTHIREMVDYLSLINIQEALFWAVDCDLDFELCHYSHNLAVWRCERFGLSVGNGCDLAGLCCCCCLSAGDGTCSHQGRVMFGYLILAEWDLGTWNHAFLFVNMACSIWSRESQNFQFCIAGIGHHAVLQNMLRGSIMFNI